MIVFQCLSKVENVDRTQKNVAPADYTPSVHLAKYPVYLSHNSAVAALLLLALVAVFRVLTSWIPAVIFIRDILRSNFPGSGIRHSFTCVIEPTP